MRRTWQSPFISKGEQARVVAAAGRTATAGAARPSGLLAEGIQADHLGALAVGVVLGLVLLGRRIGGGSLFLRLRRLRGRSLHLRGGGHRLGWLGMGIVRLRSGRDRSAAVGLARLAVLAELQAELDGGIIEA